MTRQQAVDFAAARLVRVCDNPRLDAQFLVCHACDIEQAGLFAHPETPLSRSEESRFRACCSSRRQGTPLARISGKKEFWSLEFIVNEHVLIPRPETELLVETALQCIAKKAGVKVLDLGTGCGAIAVAIARERSDCTVVAADVSTPALKVARENAKRHGADILFIHGDWYENMGRHRFDVIVSNPPYIAAEDPDLDAHVAQFEPALALISGETGLEALERIIGEAGRYLAPGGHIVLEHGFRQGQDTRRLLRQHGFVRARTCQDLAGQDRVSCARWVPVERSEAPETTPAFSSAGH